MIKFCIVLVNGLEITRECDSWTCGLLDESASHTAAEFNGLVLLDKDEKVLFAAPNDSILYFDVYRPEPETKQ